MKKALGLALAFAGTALLAGCQTQVDMVQSIPDDYRQRHPIAVREKVQSTTVFIGDGRGTLTPTQRAEVGALASGWRNEGTGGIVIEMPVGSPNERAAASATREIRSILAAAGVPHRAIEIRPYPAQDPIKLGTIRVNYPRMAAETGPCGLWPHDIGPTTDPIYWANKPAWNHGCANQRNLAAQVAEPADLVQPRAAAPVLASRRNAVIEKYRKGEPTATVSADANKGKISDLGQ
ncbi:MAG: CpaD family pilus assembly protein [Alphaproteobacteria bacterium]